MFIGKSQAKKMGLLSALIRKLTPYALILIVIIIIPKNIFGQTDRYWVYFKDKGTAKINNVSPDAILRRQLRGSINASADCDLLPSETSLDALRESGLTIHVVSRWLNAASVSGSYSALESARRFDFIDKITRVAQYSGKRVEVEPVDSAMFKSMSPESPSALDYGASYTQIHLCQIDSMHNLGYSGEGVLIGIIDTGYKLTHPAFDHTMQSGHLIGAYDFINNDDNVQDSADFEQFHGTAVWSIIGGYIPGSLIGAAYNADFLLAKTEIENSELPAEEDYWIAAIEWMEPQGVDIVTTSVGYIDWYTVDQLDGNTAAITVAADIAASLGVVVVSSAGNERHNVAWGAVVPPADGDSVIAAGGVTAQGTLWTGSSPGPTADGRIKPDVCAMSSGVITANYLTDAYGSYNGTSFAAPIIAGGIALILEAHPDWDVGEIIYNLKATASRSSHPDNDYGWGIARFVIMNGGTIPAPTADRFYVAPNPAYGSVVFRFNPALASNAELTVFTVAGDKVVRLYLSPPTDSLDHYDWQAKNSSGEKIASGIYIAHLQSASDCRTIKFAFVNY